jgi:hypothetical protein
MGTKAKPSLITFAGGFAMASLRTSNTKLGQLGGVRRNSLRQIAACHTVLLFQTLSR